MKHAGRNIDLDLMKKRLGEGKSQGVIAKELGCTRQYISSRQREWTAQGLLDARKAVATRTRRDGDGELTLDKATEVVVKAFELAAKVPVLEEENNRLRNQLAATKDALKKFEKHEDQQRRFKLAVQQGDMPNLTEHI